MRNPNQSKPLLFVVDDDENVLFLINYWFSKSSFFPVTFHYSKDMIESLETIKPDLILLDIDLGKEDGRRICQQLKEEKNVSVPIVLFSGYLPSGVNVGQWSASGFIEKETDYFSMAKKLESFLED